MYEKIEVKLEDSIEAKINILDQLSRPKLKKPKKEKLATTSAQKKKNKKLEEC